MIDIGLSDHQLIFCTRKVSHTKSHGHKHIIIRSMKNYTIDLYLESLRKLSFPNYEHFIDVNTAYSDFTEKIMGVINDIAPLKEIRAKKRTEERFDGEIAESITIRDKLFKQSKNLNYTLTKRFTMQLEIKLRN